MSWLCMPAACFCNGDPTPNDPRTGRKKEFSVSFWNACKVVPCEWCATTFCCQCVACHLRSFVLDEVPDAKWSCFQGHHSACGKFCSCFNACPTCGMCVEGTFCPGVSIASSREFLMDNRSIRSETMDFKLQRCDDCLYMVCCPCKLCTQDTFGACTAEARTVPFVCCWAAQVYAEIDSTAPPREASPPPAAQKMTTLPKSAPASSSAPASAPAATIDKSSPMSVSQKIAAANTGGAAPGMQRMPSQKAVGGNAPSTPSGAGSSPIARTPTGNSGSGTLASGSNSPNFQRVPSGVSSGPALQRTPTANRNAPALPAR